MSYCRWSSNDFDCDLYCYEDVRGGFTTHVASCRAVIDRSGLPPIPELGSPDCWSEKYIERHNALMKLLDGCEHKSIGLSCDGEQFNDPDLRSFRDRVKGLMDMGYIVPAFVLESIDEEIKEEANAR